MPLLVLGEVGAVEEGGGAGLEFAVAHPFIAALAQVVGKGAAHLGSFGGVFFIADQIGGFLRIGSKVKQLFLAAAEENKRNLGIFPKFLFLI